MQKIAYLNGRYLPQDQALIPADDRGFMFADGVYEVVRYYGGRPRSMAEHIRRLTFSLSELKIQLPGGCAPFAQISDELVARNHCPDAYIYWQITRGPAPRDHRFPDPPATPTVYAMLKPMAPLDPGAPPSPMHAITYPEIRWARCAIKSISLLPNVLARQAAHDACCEEAIFVRPDGTITEATARTIFIVHKGVVQTYPLDGSILGSITRQIVLELAHSLGLATLEMPYSREQMFDADEVFAVGTTTEVRPIVQVDQKPIAHVQIGPITLALLAAYRQRIIHECHLHPQNGV